MTEMKRDRTPSIEVFVKIADYLNCSVDYLTCRTDNKDINKWFFLFILYSFVVLVYGTAVNWYGFIGCFLRLW